MTCPKCKGFMVWDVADDPESGLRAGQHRCLNCGKIVTGEPVGIAELSRPPQHYNTKETVK